MPVIERIIASIPIWLWWVIGGLFVFAISVGLKLWFATHQLIKRMEIFSSKLPASQSGPYADPLSRARFEALEPNFSTGPTVLQGWWKSIERALQPYQGTKLKEGVYLTRPAREILPEEEVIGTAYQGAFYRTVPGILTSLGLTFTFVAILMGLAGVSVLDVGEGAKVVQGLEGLINSLSGKFLSSIVALILEIGRAHV